MLGLSKRQSFTSIPFPSKVHMLHGSRIMDCLFESSPDYAGVTGLFPVSLTPHDDTSSAVIISFASGSRALTTGAPASKPMEVYGAGLPWHDGSLLPCSEGSPLTVACTLELILLRV